MDTKPLLYGLIGFLLGGLLVSIAATTFEKDNTTDSMEGTMSDLKRVYGSDYDNAFIAGMIAHHQSAVDMARLSESHAGHTEIKDLSKDIIRAQQVEINQMKQWQQQWGYGQDDTHTHH